MLASHPMMPPMMIAMMKPMVCASLSWDVG